MPRKTTGKRGRPPERANDPISKNRIYLAESIEKMIDAVIPATLVPQANRRADLFIRNLQRLVDRTVVNSFHERISVVLLIKALAVHIGQLEEDLKATRRRTREMEETIRPLFSGQLRREFDESLARTDAREKTQSRGEFILAHLQSLGAEYLKAQRLQEDKDFGDLFWMAFDQEDVDKVLADIEFDPQSLMRLIMTTPIRQSEGTDADPLGAEGRGSPSS